MDVGYLSEKDPSYLQQPSEQSDEVATVHTNLKVMIAVVAGALIALGGLFLLLAALEILPQGINAISQLGLGSKIVGAVVIGIGVIIICGAIFYKFIYQGQTSPNFTGEPQDYATGKSSSTQTLISHPVEVEKKDSSGEDALANQEAAELVQFLKLAAEKKQDIVEGKFSQKSIKDEYISLSKDRNIPPLCGFNQFASEHFALLMPGIAAIAALLRRKHNLRNLWVCRDLNVLQTKLQEIQNSPHDQKHAFIVPTHSSMNSSGHPKAENWEQHKLAICVEKINGHMHIYMLETMLASWNGINPNRINLDESAPFTEQELVLAFIDAAKLEKSSTSVYSPSTRREFVGGCSTFALRDVVYFLRDDHFAKRLVISKSKNTLPKTGIDLQTIEALPPEYMQLTQSISTIEEYQRSYSDIANSPFASDNTKNLATNLKKSTIVNQAQNRRENHRISRNILKYQCVILELMKHASDSEIQFLINETLI